MAYVAPTPGDLKATFPAFSAVPDATVQIWLDRAARSVDQSWTEGDFAYARILLAAHLMVANRIGGIGAAAEFAGLPEGVTDVRSGSFSMSISSEVAAAAVAGGYGSTPYGRQFAALLQANKGGTRLTDTGGCVGDGFYNGYAGQAGWNPWGC